MAARSDAASQWPADGRGKKRLRLGLLAAIGPGRGPIPSELRYLSEMNWLHQHGLVSCYEDYLALPAAVLEDCHLLMEAEATASELAQAAF